MFGYNLQKKNFESDSLQTSSLKYFEVLTSFYFGPYGAHKAEVNQITDIVKRSGFLIWDLVDESKSTVGKTDTTEALWQSFLQLSGITG